MTQVWLFIAPGLYAHEKKLAIPFVVLSSICFIAGAAFSHYVVFPLTWKFFVSFTSDYLTFMPRIEPAFALYIKMILAFGARVPDADDRAVPRANGRGHREVPVAPHEIRAPHYRDRLGDRDARRRRRVARCDVRSVVLPLHVVSIALAWIFGKKKKKNDDAGFAEA